MVQMQYKITIGTEKIGESHTFYAMCNSRAGAEDTAEQVALSWGWKVLFIECLTPPERTFYVSVGVKIRSDYDSETECDRLRKYFEDVLDTDSEDSNMIISDIEEVIG